MSIDVPTDWDDTEDSLLCKIQLSSNEWNMFSSPFRHTKYKVFKIEKINTQYVWFNYSQTGDRYLALLQDPNEMFMYHCSYGTLFTRVQRD